MVGRCARGKSSPRYGQGGRAAPDRLGRQFVAGAPNRVWVADFTYVGHMIGAVHVAFVVDAFPRRIVGWAAATSK